MRKTFSSSIAFVYKIINYLKRRIDFPMTGTTGTFSIGFINSGTSFLDLSTSLGASVRASALSAAGFSGSVSCFCIIGEDGSNPALGADPVYKILFLLDVNELWGLQNYIQICYKSHVKTLNLQCVHHDII